MRTETERLCEAMAKRTAHIANTVVDRTEYEWGIRSGTTRLSVSEVGNTNPAVATVNVGTTISYAEIDDPDHLPPPTASRYQAVLTTPEQWIDVLDAQAATADEIAVAAVAVFEEYIAAARR